VSLTCSPLTLTKPCHLGWGACLRLTNRTSSAVATDRTRARLRTAARSPRPPLGPCRAGRP